MIEPGRFGLDESLRHRLRHEIRGADVEREHEVEVLDLHLDERRRLVGAGVVDQNVERLARGNRGARSLHVTHIDRKRIGLLAAIANRNGCSLDLRRGAGGERHMRAGVGQRGGRGEPDAAARAGHERAPAVEAERGRAGEVDRHAVSPSPPRGAGRVAASVCGRRWGDHEQRRPHPARCARHPPPSGEGSKNYSAACA